MDTKDPINTSGANGSAKTISFSPGNQNISLQNMQGAQKFMLDGMNTTTELMLKMTEVHQGEKYKDLVISELRFYDGDQPLILITDKMESNIAENQNTKNTLLKKIIDKAIRFDISENKETEKSSYSYGNNVSLLFRSNNSFVMYQKEGEYEEFYDEKAQDYDMYESSEETIADGNWEIVEQGKDKVVLRVFGRIYNTVDEMEVYKAGNITNETLKIFQDKITITNSEIKGEKYISKVLL